MEEAVKYLTDLAITISAENANTTELSTIPAAGNTTSKIIPLMDKKLNITNQMKRKESQALLEGVRKNRHNSNFDSDASLK